MLDCAAQGRDRPLEMSVICGLFLTGDRRRLRRSICDEVRAAASRDARNTVHVFEQPSSYFVKVETGAYESPGFVDDKGALSLLAGELILDGDEMDALITESRLAELQAAHERFKADDWSVLERARGTFCGVFAHDGNLSIFTDKLGVRPMYYWTDGDAVIVTSALRIIENCPSLALDVDERGLVETVAFGFPLGERTAYRQVKAMSGGQIVDFGRGERIRSRAYFRLDEIETACEAAPTLAKRLSEEFSRAVRLRLRSDDTVNAFLSGGLDSRCVVGALLELGTKVNTYNFSPAGWADECLARQAADRIGTNHFERSVNSVEGGGEDWPRLVAAAVARGDSEPYSAGERRRTIWGGDGGSVIGGHVYLTEAMVQALRAGRREAAVEEFLAQQFTSVGAGILSRTRRARAIEMPKRGMLEELECLRCDDPGRELYYFLIRNDQRRHLAGHFENVDKTRIEYQLPFFDANVAAIFASGRIDDGLRHHFYMMWFEEFREEIRSIPWQAYPDHEPCPLPSSAVTQWEPDVARRTALRAKQMAGGIAVLKESRFPDDLLSRSRLHGALWLARLHLRDCGHLFEAAVKYNRCWQICGAHESGKALVEAAPEEFAG